MHGSNSSYKQWTMLSVCLHVWPHSDLIVPNISFRLIRVEEKNVGVNFCVWLKNSTR
jgi:hypothetical protein